jgi:hypothetical protein
MENKMKEFWVSLWVFGVFLAPAFGKQICSDFSGSWDGDCRMDSIKTPMQIKTAQTECVKLTLSTTHSPPVELLLDGASHATFEGSYTAQWKVGPDGVAARLFVSALVEVVGLQQKVEYVFVEAENKTQTATITMSVPQLPGASGIIGTCKASRGRR